MTATSRPTVREGTLGRFRWALRTTRVTRPRTLVGRIRLLWHDFVIHALLNRGGERCQDCGRSYPLWWATDVLYESLIGDIGGLFCPACIDDRAHRQGVLLRWHPEIVEADLDRGLGR